MQARFSSVYEGLRRIAKNIKRYVMVDARGILTDRNKKSGILGHLQ